MPYNDSWSQEDTDFIRGWITCGFILFIEGCWIAFLVAVFLKIFGLIRFPATW